MSKLVLTPLGAGNYQYVIRIRPVTKDSHGSHEEGGIPEFSVLKILRNVNIKDYKSRIKFHSRFRTFLNETLATGGERGDGSTSEHTVPFKKLCIIDKGLTDRLRVKFNRVLSGSFDQSPGDRNKVLILYDKYLEDNHSITVDSDSLRVLAGGLNDYDSDRFELGSLEPDLFSSIKLYRNLDRTKVDCVVRNLSVELKPKCGVRNFKKYPSLFRLNQKNKRDLNYVASNGSDVAGIFGLKQESQYDPCSFFELNRESMISQFKNLVKVPQNNLRVFVDGYQLFPDAMFAPAGGAASAPGDSTLSPDEMVQMLVECMLRNGNKLVLLVKLHALAAGSQVVASLLYSLYRFALSVVRPENIRNGSVSDCGDQGDLVPVFTRAGLYNKFKSKRMNHYRIQAMFHKAGVKLAIGVTIKVLKLVNSLGYPCRLYLQGQNLVIHRSVNTARGKRIKTKFNHGKHGFFALLDSLARSFVRNHLTPNSGDQGMDLLVFPDGVIRAVTKALHFHPRFNKLLRRSLSLELDRMREWIYLYLCGRVSMDLSVILNILYHSGPGAGHDPASRVLYHKLSFVDVDLKSIHKIYRWKYNLLKLVDEHPV